MGSNFSIWLGYLGLGFLGIAGFFFIYDYRRLYRLQKSLNDDLNIRHFVQSHLQEAWCYWSPGADFMNCSENLHDLLNIEDGVPLALKDFLKIFGNSPFSPFSQALDHLCKFGGQFHLHVSVLNDTRCLEIRGNLFSSFPTQPKAILLSFKDVTAEAAQKRHDQEHCETLQLRMEALKTLINQAPLALWHRNQDGRLDYCNHQYAKMLETTVHTVLAEGLELIDLKQALNAYELSKHALLTNTPQVTTFHKVIKGERRLLEVGEIPIKKLGVTVGYAMDITAIEAAKNERHQNTNAQHEVLQYISVPIAIYDAKTTLTFFNQAYLKLFDFDENWLCTKPTHSEILENLRERRKLPEYSNFLDYKRQSLGLFKDLMQPIHELLHLPDGQTLRTVIAPHPLGGLIFVFDDMTNQLSLERGYNTLVAVQKETLDHLYEGLVVFGTDNRLRLSNPSMAKIWRLDPEAIEPGRHISEILKSISPLFIDPQESRTWRKRMIEQVINRRAGQGMFRLKGEQMIEYTYVPLPDGANLLTFVDVSDRWRFEESLKNRALNLEQKERYKSDFVSHVAYELRAALSSIHGFNEILLNQYFGPLNDRQKDYSQNIATSTQRLTGLIDNMIELATFEAGKLVLTYQEAVMEDFLASSMVIVEARAREQEVTLVLENQMGTKQVTIDIKRLQHAIANLLSNAIKFTPAGGKITLKAALSLERKDHFQLVIQDTGIGIPIDEQQKILESLDYKSSQSNTGLSLQLAKHIIELHGGSITIESAPHHGTRVICLLPLEACAKGVWQ
ncbi:PAS domain-containing sensor histidine kinase [Candidatus Finniella inopinata]|uniref:histidine kinase n=1 Tax=Candidatus Finniella inopinata TaxID=1696036 RepID=A0A4Q7DMS6_9PROT|nr:PAS domain-containing sensor histidine kinase [Candidatus Finniella inopinata]RZI46126.1 PAS domain-containing protein [Candidatus Finniella inopinata]